MKKRLIIGRKNKVLFKKSRYLLDTHHKLNLLSFGMMILCYTFELWHNVWFIHKIRDWSCLLIEFHSVHTLRFTKISNCTNYTKIFITPILDIIYLSMYLLYCKETLEWDKIGIYIIECESWFYHIHLTPKSLYRYNPANDMQNSTLAHHG